LFEHAPVGVALCAPDGRFLDVNEALRGLLTGSGVDPGTGGLTDLAGAADDPGADAWREGLTEVGAGARVVVRAELPVASPGRAPRWLQATAARVDLGGRAYLLAHVEDMTSRRLEHQQLLRLALHDGLTGLANRTLLAERLEQALDRSNGTGLPVGVLFCDIDGFKDLNDGLGHEAGDAVLVAVARRLTSVLRATDTAARLGGDEFVVVAGDVVDASALAEVERRVCAAVEAPVRVAGREVPVRASVGAVLSRPGDTGDGLLRRADAVMYAVKRVRRRAVVRSAAGRPPRDQLVLLREQAVVADLRDTTAVTGTPGGSGPGVH
ncbi:MAG: diguanylate cyclase, partial [Kineosporiaceae bacterium]